jgi:hypothetical protein
MTRRWFTLEVGCIVAVLVEFALLAFVAGVAERRGEQVVRLRDNERVLATRCVIRPDGSVESCPAGLVHVDRVRAAK